MTPKAQRADAAPARVLKQDLLGRVELVAIGGEQGVRRVASRWPVVGWIARWLAARERRALQALAGMDGVPQWRADAGVRSFLVGEPLATAKALPRDYFELLEALVAELHRRGVCHNDLHKEGNILVRADGRPAVVDFQLASVHRTRGRSFRVQQSEDLRHVQKHRAIYCRAMPGAPPRAPRELSRSLSARLWRRLWKPVYNTLMRRTGLRARIASGEPRRREVWPEWTPPIGATSSGHGPRDG